MIIIDGAYGEGGGQILRSSLSLSALTGKPLLIHHIRANRSQPGLRAQHLAAVRAIAQLTQAETEGVHLGSDTVSLKPAKLQPGRYQFDIETAGSVALVLQTIYLPLSFADGPSQVILTGGTHVPWSPSIHTLEMHWLPLINQLGFRLQIELKNAGFYPKGGGEVFVKILPADPLQTCACSDRGELFHINGVSGVANLDDSIAKRQKHQALRRLYAVEPTAKIKTVRLPSHTKGTFIILRASFSKCGSACYTALGAPGKPAEQVADEAVDQMLSFLKTDGCVDQFLADQLLLPLSFSPGRSSFQTNCITEHLLTNIHVIKQFLDIPIQAIGKVGQPGHVNITGLQKRNWE